MVEVDSYRIRPARLEDVDAVVALDGGEGGAQWPAQAYANELTLAWSHFEVVELAENGAGDGLVGALVYWVIADEIQLLNIMTAPTRRRQGIGRVMMVHLLSQARGAGSARVTLEVRRTNVAAISLYQTFGFVEVGSRRAYYQKSGEDAVLMECRLGPISRGA